MNVSSPIIGPKGCPWENTASNIKIRTKQKIVADIPPKAVEARQLLFNQTRSGSHFVLICPVHWRYFLNVFSAIGFRLRDFLFLTQNCVWLIGEKE